MTQNEALIIMHSGVNVFLTGAPGAGKTYALNEFIKKAEEFGQSIAITASTGIAASHIGGITIHSWAGIGIREELADEDLARMKNNKRLRKRYENTDILVIDEISMLHGYRLDMVNKAAKYIRNSQKPFGGIQVILVGDLFQLPPVTKGSNIYEFVHLSSSWSELNLQICYLTEQHRQTGDDTLLKFLEAMRQNNIDDTHISTLKMRICNGAEDNITKLFSHNVDVDVINQSRLDMLPGKIKTYKMHSSGDPYQIESLKRNILAPEKLDLKINTEVMFVANNFEAGFFNGSRGRVIKFKKGDPIIKLQNGRIVKAEPHSWKTKIEDMTIAEVEQIPLRLAWAITIHKSQGMSLDSAEVDLSNAFTPGMGYVALSRVRSFEGLYLRGFNDMALTMHEEIYDLDKFLRRESETLITKGSRK